jgi:site-specific recombinase XerD
MTNIETVISEFESQLRDLGLSELNGALLIQLKIYDQNYIKSIGDLNFLRAPAITLENHKHSNLIDFINKEIELSTNSESTKQLHLDTVKLIKRYTPNISIQEVTYTYLQELSLYMQKERGLAVNTIARHMKVLKKYINIAIKKELIVKYPFLNYSIRSEQSRRESLTEKEVKLLEDYRNQLEKPNEVLNAFLFSCYTGLRYSDVRCFTKQNIFTINRKKWIIIKTRKTKTEIRIPISIIFEGKALAITRSILNSRGLLFHLRNNQQVNRELKKIIKAVGIKKEITFHTARHTCATLLIYHGVNLIVLRKLLGHKNVKTTQIYSAVTDLTLEKELRKSNRKINKKTHSPA